MGNLVQDLLCEAWLASIFFLNLSKNTGLRNVFKIQIQREGKEAKQLGRLAVI